MEANTENQLLASRESSLKATRRYRSRDKRNVIQRSEDHMRRKADRQDIASQNLRSKLQSEMQECTFRPALRARSSSARRMRDEREMERHLRQLAHKQLDVRARLVQLEREWLRAHRQHKAMLARRIKEEIQSRKQEVFELLNTKEGQGYYWERVQRLSEAGVASSSKLAQTRVLSELLEDQKHIIEQQVGVEVENELKLNARDLEFRARRNVLLESLEGIEARAAPTLGTLSDMPEGAEILKESGFSQGLAQQMRDDVPDPERPVSRQSSFSPERCSVAAADGAASVGSPKVLPVRSFSVQSPVVYSERPVGPLLSTVSAVPTQVVTASDCEAATGLASGQTSVAHSLQLGAMSPRVQTSFVPVVQTSASSRFLTPRMSLPTRMISGPTRVATQAAVQAQPVTTAITTATAAVTTPCMTPRGSQRPSQVFRLQSAGR
jgi:hypothetical protein